MIWKDDFPFASECESRGTVDGGTYRALIMPEHEGNLWIATVDLYLASHHYVATWRFCPDVVTAQIWAEAACLQLQRIAERLGEVEQ